jgi:UDP-N-acetylmuramate--alanine ligase
MAAGGVGMAAVAELLLAQGHDVSGCDSADSPRLRRLASLGVKTCTGHSPDHLTGVGRLVVSSAIRPDNPELLAAQAQPGLVIQHRSVALAGIAKAYRQVVVTGTHGKTTTSAMIVSLLEAAGLEPSYAIGSELTGRGSGAKLRAGSIMVLEADESDASFLNYRPEVAVVTNIEADHLDHYGDQAALTEAFRRFASLVVDPSVLIACAADPPAAALAKWAEESGQAPLVWTYSDEQADRSPVSLPGRHMRLNAAAAALVGEWFGVDPEVANRGLRQYAGTARRFESHGRPGGVTVLDDYAHHPTEIAATIAAARQLDQPGRILVVFQPHLYSRTNQFQAEFAAALSQADQVWLLDIYGAREEPVPGVTSELIAKRMDPAVVTLVSQPETVPAAIRAAARAGDIVFTMGAGDVTNLARPIVEALEQP